MIVILRMQKMAIKCFGVIEHEHALPSHALSSVVRLKLRPFLSLVQAVELCYLEQHMFELVLHFLFAFIFICHNIWVCAIYSLDIINILFLMSYLLSAFIMFILIINDYIRLWILIRSCLMCEAKESVL